MTQMLTTTESGGRKIKSNITKYLEIAYRRHLKRIEERNQNYNRKQTVLGSAREEKWGISLVHRRKYKEEPQTSSK